MDAQLSEFGKVFVFLLVGILFVVLGFLTSRLIRPHRPNPEKLTSYECGEEPVGTAWIQFNIRFYVVALIFIIFDVELLFLFPWATVFKDVGTLALIEALIFVGILAVGLAYAWVKGDLEWVVPQPHVPQMPTKRFEMPPKKTAPKAEPTETV
ncbi:MAG: NADH-quinone oxidoreductase subunit A [Candidatus Thermochlorobacter aerophilum]|jgi:NADH-quinone oxidoreductase subunit A|uniref:NADH-quinone oxidoreductase subunit A n=1 Tax=Candidatus Thermochlorobacter aerophilus TaxID=1868324 RepID=A0A395M0Y9_9BACT|nr:MAG: NADH-quinone oxidoreductase subunit A [Candidatus Thermochlorobacter aerophilum]